MLWYPECAAMFRVIRSARFSTKVRVSMYGAYSSRSRKPASRMTTMHAESYSGQSALKVSAGTPATRSTRRVMTSSSRKKLSTSKLGVCLFDARGRGVKDAGSLTVAPPRQ